MTEELPTRRPGRRLVGPSEGETVGGYRLESRVGAGGMAVVFRARDERLDRAVALKVLVPALTLDEEFRERFIRESRAASVVDHPSIIPIYGAGEDHGVLYLAMRHVSGGDLHSVVEKEGPLPRARAIALLAPVASALDAAHRAGIIHRDVKLANVLVDTGPGRPDHPYLSDFGLAKREAAARLTAAGEFVGTPGFAAPEQIDGQAPRAESDQYALACVAFASLTASLPFQQGSTEAMLWAQMSQPPPKVTPHRPDLPPAVDDVIARGMARNPADRYPDCTAFVGALSQALEGRVPIGPAAVTPDRALTAPPTPAPAPPLVSVPGPAPAPALRRLPRRGRRLAVAAASTVVAAIAVIVGVHEVSGLRGTPEASRARGEAGPRLVATLRGDGAQTAVAFGPGGTLETVDRIGGAHVYGIGSERPRTSFPVRSAYAPNDDDVQFGLSGEEFAVPVGPCTGFGATPCSYDVYDVAKRQRVASVAAGSLAAAGTGDFALGVVNDDTVGDAVRIWDMRALDTIATLTEPGDRVVETVAVSPDARTAATASDTVGGTHRIHIWNLASQTVTATLTVPRSMGARWTTVLQAGKPMALGGTTLAISDGLTTETYSLGSPARPSATKSGGLLALSPDGTLLATTDPASANTVELWNTETGKKAAALVVPEAQPFMARAVFSADGNHFAVNCKSGRTYVWAVARS